MVSRFRRERRRGREDSDQVDLVAATVRKCGVTRNTDVAKSVSNTQPKGEQYVRPKGLRGT